MSETTKRYLRKDFGATFDRHINGGTSTSMRRKAALLGVPVPSLGHMVSGARPVNTDLVMGLARLIPGVDLDAEFFVDRPAVLSGRALPRKTTARAA